MTLILFDIDGTLTATSEVDASCYASAFAKTFGVALPTTDWSVYEHCTDFAIASEALLSLRGAPPSADECEAFEQAFVADLRKEYAVNPRAFDEVAGARAILEAIGARSDVRAALATGGMRSSACYKLSRVGVDATKMPAAFANDAASRGDIARRAIARADGRRLPEGETLDVVYVGDGPWDVKTAAGMQMRFIGIADGASAERLRALGATTIMKDYSDQSGFWQALQDATVPQAGDRGKDS